MDADEATGAGPPSGRRRRGLRLLAALMVAALVLSPGVAEAGLTAEVNQDRAAAGLPPVAEDPALNGVAQARSQHMAATGTLAHTPGVLAAVDAVLPVPVTSAGENVGVGANATLVNDIFIGSPAHRSNILGPYNLIGVAAAVGRDGRTWVTQVFASVAPAPPPPAPPPAARRVAVRRCRSRRACRRRVVRRARSRCRSTRRRCRRSRSVRRTSVRVSYRRR
jgi:hypothetical protein